MRVGAAVGTAVGAVVEALQLNVYYFWAYDLTRC